MPMLPASVQRALRVARLVIHPRKSFGLYRGMGILAEEVSNLELENVGVEDSVPFVKLKDGPIFFGRKPDLFQRIVYRRLVREQRRQLPECCAGVAVDIVCRYVYPQAAPQFTPPYSASLRAAMHKQHQDTLGDLAYASQEERSNIYNQFEIRQGDTVLDVGAFIGFGAMRLGRLVGPAGTVVSVEAQEENQKLFLQNMRANKIDNVHLVAGAVWSEPGELDLQCDSRQKNSLVEGIVSSDSQKKVPTYTIDQIVDMQGLHDVSLVSLTINGAEPDALRGMTRTFRDFGPRLLAAGWYRKDGKLIHELLQRELASVGYQVVVGPVGRVYAWKQ